MKAGGTAQARGCGARLGQRADKKEHVVPPSAAKAHLHSLLDGGGGGSSGTHQALSCSLQGDQGRQQVSRASASAAWLWAFMVARCGNVFT